MKLTAALCTLLVSSSLWAHGVHLVDKQFPEDGKTYQTGVDLGFDQFKSKSLKGTRTVSLTFDDGPHSVYTPKILDLLKRYNVKATFFMLTENITPSTIEIVKRIAREGHIIASHHHNHNNNNEKGESQYRAELKESIRAVAKIMQEVDAPHKEIYYRFPYGAYGARGLSYHHFNVMKEVSNELFGENCINFAFWDIDSLDWLKPMDKGDIVSNVVAHVDGGTAYNMTRGRFTGKYKKDRYTISRPMGGGVVLMHDIHEKSVEATEILLKTLANKGIQVVPLNEVEEYSFAGKECKLK